MSSVVYSSFGTVSATPSSVENSNGVYTYQNDRLPLPEYLRYATQKKTVASNARLNKNIKRRLVGILLEMQADYARVAFIENGEKFYYDLPANILMAAGIEHQNQPFQMDEFETKAEDGGLIVGHYFSPLAKAKDAYIQTLNFDEEYKRKRETVLRGLQEA